MNYWIIIGTSLGVLSVILNFVGLVLQQKEDAKFKGSVDTYVSEENQRNIPILTVLNAYLSQDKKKIVLKIGNSGKQSPTKTSIVFTEHPVPLAKSIEITMTSVPSGQQKEVDFDLFLQEKSMEQLSSNNEEFKKMKESYVDFLKKFKTGEKAVVIHFNLKYEYDGILYQKGYIILYTSTGDFAFTPREF